MSDKARERIGRTLSQYESALVAYSGGVDSTLLAVLAHKAYGDRMLAVFAHSPFVSPSAEKQARTVAAQMGFPFLEIDHPGFAEDANDNAEGTSALWDNPKNRCYLCKRALLEGLGELANERGFSVIMHGENLDDLGEDRPGAKAAHELGVVAPFVEADITKNDIRTLAHEIGLPNADAPSDSCLATRIPFDTKMDQQVLNEIAETEERLRALFPNANRIRAKTYGIRHP